VAQAKNGDRVKVHYTGKLEDESVFDSSGNRQPLEFTIGSGQVIPGFDKGVLGMKVGEKKTITVAPEEAYGPVREEMIRAVERSRLPKNVFFAVGERVRIPRADGSILNATVKAMDENTVTLDANHPFAGKTLLFDLELVSIA
jgi:peptidylprolyl isomerase